MTKFRVFIISLLKNRFGTGEGDGLLLVLLNAVSKKAAFIQVYDTKTWTLVQTRKVSAKPITTFALRFGFDF